jgi:hypothetical protein
LVVDENGARIWAIQTGEEVHKGRLAGPILAENGVNLPSVKVDADVIDSESAWKGFGDFPYGDIGHGRR